MPNVGDCPVCGSDRVERERRPEGFTRCMMAACGFQARHAEWDALVSNQQVAVRAAPRSGTVRVTAVFEFPDGAAPIVSADSSWMSGRIVSVSFADDLMELEAARDLMELVRRAITDPKYGHDGAWVRANILRRLDAFLT